MIRFSFQQFDMSPTFLKAKQNSFSNVRCVKLQATDCSVEWKITKRLLHLYLFLIHTFNILLSETEPSHCI